MKIVQINTTFNQGSIGRTTAEVHGYLVANGDASYVFTSTVDDKANNVYCIGNTFDHKIHGLLSKLFGLQAYFSHVPTRKLLRKLDGIKPDVVHLRNLHSNYINLPMLLRYLAKKNIATVLTLHDCWFITGKCCYYTHVNCDKWKSECHDCPALKYDNVSWFFDRTRKVYNDKKRLFSAIPRLAVCGNSQWTTDQASKSFLKDASYVGRIYNWIDQEVYHFEDCQDLRVKHNLEGKFVVLGVSQGWSNRKGLDIFIKLANSLPLVKFVLVGKMNSNEQLPDNIISVGQTQNIKELCKYYSLADVFINPSLQETFGKVSAEALCCGTPIIVNNATANPELVGDGCGYVVNNNDISEYVSCLNRIQTAGKGAFSSKCIAFAKENFDRETNIREYINLYHKLIDK